MKEYVGAKKKAVVTHRICLAVSDDPNCNATTASYHHHIIIKASILQGLLDCLRSRQSSSLELKH
jgi:hypothetical protein